MKRGDIVTVASAGEFGKPRPALIIQASVTFPSPYVTYLPITSDLLRAPGVRISIVPTETNGLRLPSEIMVDLIQTSSVAKLGKTIGEVDGMTMKVVEAALFLHLGLYESRLVH